MPIYQYTCTGCGKSQDKLVSIKESADTTFKCECGADMKKTFSAINTHFELKGKGWFAKDGRY